MWDFRGVGDDEFRDEGEVVTVEVGVAAEAGEVAREGEGESGEERNNKLVGGAKRNGHRKSRRGW